MFSVVKFTKSTIQNFSIACVPTAWLLGSQNNLCCWPPEDPVKLAAESADPDCTWQLQQCQVLDKTG